MSTTTDVGPGAGADLERRLEAHRRELTAYCYRMLGSGFEAEDAVQETMVRAWKASDAFEGRSSFRSWLYRIATNVCLDMLRGPQRRARAMDMGPPTTTAEAKLDTLPEHAWIQPIEDGRVLPDGDPADVALARESIRLAFVAALQHLPPKQRAVLILCEVLRWQATEVAELLATTVASVNSALQRARATLVERQALEPGPTGRAGLDADHRDLLERYVSAFERYDMDSLVSLLHADVVFSMPPHPIWLSGPEEVVRWMTGPGIGCDGSKLLATSANGCAAFAQYKPAAPGVWTPWSIQVVEISGDRISAIHNFLFTELFDAFGFPPEIVTEEQR